MFFLIKNIDKHNMIWYYFIVDKKEISIKVYYEKGGKKMKFEMINFGLINFLALIVNIISCIIFIKESWNICINKSFIEYELLKTTIFIFMFSLFISSLDFKTSDMSLIIIIFQLILFFIPSFLIGIIGYYKERKERKHDK